VVKQRELRGERQLEICSVRAFPKPVAKIRRQDLHQPMMVHSLLLFLPCLPLTRVLVDKALLSRIELLEAENKDLKSKLSKVASCGWK